MVDLEDRYCQISVDGMRSQSVFASCRWIKVSVVVMGGSCCMLLAIASMSDSTPMFHGTDLDESTSLFSFSNLKSRPQTVAVRPSLFDSAVARVFRSVPGNLSPARAPTSVDASWDQSEKKVDSAGREYTEKIYHFADATTPASSPSPAPSQERGPGVVVIGAGGRTGRLVLERLLSGGMPATGLVRTEDKATNLIEAVSRTFEGSSVSSDTCHKSVSVADVLDEAALAKKFSGAKALVICSSATPQIKKRSIVRMMLKQLIGRKGRPSFRFPPSGTPEEVDYEGVKNIIGAAKEAGVKRVVLVGSMGGTQKDNYLNTIGEGKNDGEQGNVLVWKRKAEMELIRSGLTYTIIHPGGLIDEEGGKRGLIIGVDDDILNSTMRTVPRADVAALAVACLDSTHAMDRAFDISSYPVGYEGAVPTKELAALVGTLGSKTCDYSINMPPGTSSDAEFFKKGRIWNPPAI